MVDLAPRVKIMQGFRRLVTNIRVHGVAAVALQVERAATVTNEHEEVSSNTGIKAMLENLK